MIFEKQRPLRSEQQRKTVVILGGKGGLESRYRELFSRYGYELKHFERRVSSKTLPAAHKVALVIVMVSMISHPLMAQARLFGDETNVVYLHRPSISAVQRMVNERLVPAPTR